MPSAAGAPLAAAARFSEIVISRPLAWSTEIVHCRFLLYGCFCLNVAFVLFCVGMGVLCWGVVAVLGRCCCVGALLCLWPCFGLCL